MKRKIFYTAFLLLTGMSAAQSSFAYEMGWREYMLTRAQDVATYVHDKTKALRDSAWNMGRNVKEKISRGVSAVQSFPKDDGWEDEEETLQKLNTADMRGRRDRRRERKEQKVTGKKRSKSVKAGY